MDDKIKNLLEELRNAGFDDSKLAMYISLLFEDFIDMMKADITDLEESQIDEIEELLKSVSLSDLSNAKENLLLNQVLKKLYGFNGETKYKQFLIDELEKALVDVKKIQEFVKSYNPNDPESVKKLEEAKNDPNYEDMVTAIKSLSE